MRCHKRSVFFSAIFSTLFFAGAPCVQAENLTEVYRMAEQFDPALRAAAQARAAARENLPQAQANFLPNIGMNGSSSYTWNDYPTQPSSSSDANTYGIILNQSIYSRQNFALLDKAELVVQQADVNYADSQQELILRVTQAYFEVLRTRAAFVLAQSDLQAAQKRLEQTQKRYDVGLIPVTDLADALAARDQRSAAVIKAENALSFAKEGLRTITGQTVESLVDVKDSLELLAPVPNDVKEWTSFAEKQNLKLQSTELAVNISREDIEVQRSGHYPSVDMFASYTYQDTPVLNNLSTTRDAYYYESQIGVQLTVPLYQGGAVSSRTRQATYSFQQAQDQYEAARLDTVRNTLDSFRTVNAKIDEVKAFQQGKKSAQMQLEANEAGYQVGTRTIVDVINAQNQLSLAISNLNNSRYDYLLTVILLKRYAGTLAVSDLEQLQRQLQ
ncbi:MAG: TolC family outer membrane protein [Pseudomonadota bacterium]